jgi:hypothetical protein
MRMLVAVLTLAACGGAATEPAAPAAAPKPPCFPDGPPLEASALYQQLERHAMSFMQPESAPPPEAFGTCKVSGTMVRAADGTPVAELGCGVRILTRGIRDDLGLELGARGQDVIDRTPAPRPRMFCTANGPGQARCGLERTEEDDLDGTAYVVAGDVDDVLVGADAEAFFGPKTIIEIHTSVWCH